MLSEPVCAWLAALIDGEGSVMLNKRKPRPTSSRPSYRPVVVVAYNTDLRLMDAIQDRLGVGQMYTQALPEKMNHKKIAYSHRLNVGQIETVLPQVLPWLVIKSEQAGLLLRAIELKNGITSRPGARYTRASVELATAELDTIYDEIRRLNTKGRESL